MHMLIRMLIKLELQAEERFPHVFDTFTITKLTLSYIKTGFNNT